jgi:hypothetical protein
LALKSDVTALFAKALTAPETRARLFGRLDVIKCVAGAVMSFPVSCSWRAMTTGSPDAKAASERSPPTGRIWRSCWTVRVAKAKIESDGELARLRKVAQFQKTVFEQISRRLIELPQVFEHLESRLDAAEILRQAV